MDAAAARVVVAPERGLDRLVQRREREILAREVPDPPACAARHGGHTVGRGEERRERQTLVGADAIDGVLDARAQHLHGARERTKKFVGMLQVGHALLGGRE
ncbi:MAG TPA: hypothetical protein VKM54_28935 [Myxococcota bacterium]|nr:hypothetical protein [Myxococcota bacterium]